MEVFVGRIASTVHIVSILSLEAKARRARLNGSYTIHYCRFEYVKISGFLSDWGDGAVGEAFSW